MENEAKKILQLVGGSKNVNGLVHCATRLRFELKDVKKANKETLELLPDVLSVVVSGGQYQVVIGPKVNSFYEVIMKDLDIKESKGGGSKSVLKVISGAFSPLIPILAGAGMVKALLTVLVQCGLISDVSSTYAVLSAAGNSIFYFMPIFLGITLSKQFNANPYVGGAIGAALLDPSFAGLIGTEGLNFMGLSITAVDYAATIFPIFIISFIYAGLEKGLKKIIKLELQIFLVPMICLVLLVPLAVIAFGPFGTIIAEAVSNVVMWLFDFNRVLAGVVLGAAYPFLTMLGLHWGFTPITLQNLTLYGGDVIEGVAVCCVYAELGIALGVFLKGKKHSKIKGIASPALLTGFLAGVTEPILYGIVMRYKRLLAVVAIAGGVGGAINGLCKVTMDSYVFHNVFSAAMMSYSPFIPFLVGISAAFITGVLLTYFWGITKESEADFVSEMEMKEIEVKKEVLTADQKFEIFSPIKGACIALENVNDQVFASGTVGQGIAIMPSEGKVLAPFDGEVIVAFPSKHAIGLRSETGIEVLIHVGINTVMLDGEYFTSNVQQGMKITKGDALLEFDISSIEKAGYSAVTPVLITNTDDLTIQANKKENELIDYAECLITVAM